MSLDNCIGNKVCVLFVFVARLIGFTLEGDPRSLLHNVRSFVCREVKVRLRRECDVSVARERFGTELMIRLCGRSADMRTDGRDVVASKARLDPIEVRQSLTFSAKRAFCCCCSSRRHAGPRVRFLKPRFGAREHGGRFMCELRVACIAIDVVKQSAKWN